MFSSSSSSSSSASISSASNPIDEVALTASESFLIPPLENIVAQYSFDINDSAWLTKPFTLFGIPSVSSVLKARKYSEQFQPISTIGCSAHAA